MSENIHGNGVVWGIRQKRMKKIKGMKMCSILSFQWLSAMINDNIKRELREIGEIEAEIAMKLWIIEYIRVVIRWDTSATSESRSTTVPI
jgi:hypothetical protein